MRNRFKLIIAFLLALTLSGGVYAYTFSTASGTINIAEPTGDIATCNATDNETQPEWEDILIPVADTEIFRPDAIGDETNISSQYPSSGAHWDKVDEETADDFTTYVYTNSTSNQTDLYDIPDHSTQTAAGTINSVTVYFRFAGDTWWIIDTTGYAKAAIKTHGTVYEGSEESQTGRTFVTRSYEWTTNPNTGSAWTWDEIDALQIGASLRSSTTLGDAHCTQVYVEVGFEAPLLCGDVPTGELFTVTPHADYSGDLAVKVYLVNTGNLTKAYQSLNMELYLENSVEAGETPNYRVLTLENGVATFSLEDQGGISCTLSVTGGNYCLVSRDVSAWEEGWTVTPELYCEVTQR